jgi:hypothetical protein
MSIAFTRCGAPLDTVVEMRASMSPPPATRGSLRKRSYVA